MDGRDKPDHDTSGGGCPSGLNRAAVRRELGPGLVPLARFAASDAGMTVECGAAPHPDPLPVRTGRGRSVRDSQAQPRLERVEGRAEGTNAVVRQAHHWGAATVVCVWPWVPDICALRNSGMTDAYSLRARFQLDQCRPPASEMNRGPMSTWMWSRPG